MVSDNMHYDSKFKRDGTWVETKNTIIGDYIKIVTMMFVGGGYFTALLERTSIH